MITTSLDPFPKMENLSDEIAFDLDALRINLPHKRGLSRYYSGKARSFTCMADVRCLEDLKKPEPPFNNAKKKRKKHMDRREISHLPPSFPCRRIASSAQFATAPCVGGV